MSATFTATPVVWVRVECFTGDAIDGLLCWLSGQPAVCPVMWRTRGTTGGVEYVAGFAPDDAERVIAWLRENGCAERRSE